MGKERRETLSVDCDRRRGKCSSGMLRIGRTTVMWPSPTALTCPAGKVLPVGWTIPRAPSAASASRQKVDK